MVSPFPHSSPQSSLTFLSFEMKMFLIPYKEALHMRWRGCLNADVMHPFGARSTAWKKDTLWSFPSWYFNIKTNVVSLLEMVWPRSFNCLTFMSWQPITCRNGTYNPYWCWQPPHLTNATCSVSQSPSLTQMNIIILWTVFRSAYEGDCLMTDHS